MGETSNIAWTRSTFNPWIGCSKVSEACRSCYAESFASGRMGLRVWGPSAERSLTSESGWRLPERWNRKAAKTGEFWPVFCSSLADVFEDRRDLDAPRARLFELIERTPALTWQLLTKRPERMVDLAPERWRSGWPANVWGGTTVETQRWADVRIPLLRAVPARVRFLSCEPQLESLASIDLAGIQWAIAGGESGPGSRPYDPQWALDVIAACRTAGAAPFVKQLGTVWARSVHARSPHGSDPAEWPEALRVREWPQGTSPTSRPAAVAVHGRLIP